MKSALAIFILAASLSAGFGQIPGTMSYQGFMPNPATGDPVANGPHSVKFAFYDAALDGILKWETSVIQVTTFKGLFDTFIPIPESANWDIPLFVEITVDGVVLENRVQLTTVPYAFKAYSAASMNAAGLTGTINDQRLTDHLRDLADGELTGSKIGEGIVGEKITAGTISGVRIGTGINATNITTGTLASGVLPTGLVTGTGTAGQLAYWSAASQVSADGLYWDQIQNELGIGKADPIASTDIFHDGSHTSGVALNIENTWSLAGTKTGLNIGMTPNGSGATYGINVSVTGTGSGTRDGINSGVTSTLGSPALVSGITGSATALGVGAHTGVYGKTNGSAAAQLFAVKGESTGTGSGEQTGVYGSVIANSGAAMYGVKARCESTGSGNKYGVYAEVLGVGLGTHYGVYATASGGTENFAVYGAGNIYATGTSTAGSDRKLKKDIQPLGSSIAKIRQLKPSTYYYRHQEFPSFNFSKTRQIGLIAQEVEELLPELVSDVISPRETTNSDSDTPDKSTYKALNYVALIPVLIKGMQEQQAMIDELKTEIEKLKISGGVRKVNAPEIKASLNR